MLWALEVSTVPPLPGAGRAPLSHPRRGAGAQGGLIPHPSRCRRLRSREVLWEEAEVTLRHRSPHELWCYCMVQNVNPKQS